MLKRCRPRAAAVLFAGEPFLLNIGEPSGLLPLFGEYVPPAMDFRELLDKNGCGLWCVWNAATKKTSISIFEFTITIC